MRCLWRHVHLPFIWLGLTVLAASFLLPYNVVIARTDSMITVTAVAILLILFEIHLLLHMYIQSHELDTIHLLEVSGYTYLQHIRTIQMKSVVAMSWYN